VDIKLWQQVSCAFNGSGHELWKEAYKRREGSKIRGGFESSFVNVDGIAQCLESIETDSNGKNYVQRIRSDLHSKEGKRRDKIIEEEIIIFEESKKAQVCSKAYPKKYLSP